MAKIFTEEAPMPTGRKLSLLNNCDTIRAIFGPYQGHVLAIYTISILEEYPDLYQIVTTAFHDGPEVWCSFLADPTTHPMIFEYKQLMVCPQYFL